jgi:hypothetical protein
MAGADREGALARAGRALLDREKAGEDVKADAEVLKRWCAARLHDPPYRGWVIFRFRRAGRGLAGRTPSRRPARIARRLLPVARSCCSLPGLTPRPQSPLYSKVTSGGALGLPHHPPAAAEAQ